MRISNSLKVQVVSLLLTLLAGREFDQTFAADLLEAIAAELRGPPALFTAQPQGFVPPSAQPKKTRFQRPHRHRRRRREKGKQPQSAQYINWPPTKPGPHPDPGPQC